MKGASKFQSKLWALLRLFWLNMFRAGTIFFLIATSTSPCLAGLLRLESETLSSVRSGDDLRLEYPNYEFLGANYVTDSHNLEMNADLGVFSDPRQSKSDFNLYLLNLAYTPISNRLTFFFGRNFDIQHSVRSTSMDNAGLDLWLFDKRVKIGTFYGHERKIELDSTTPTARLAGVSAQYQSSSLFPLLAKGKLQYRNYLNTSNTHEYLTQLSIQKSFSGTWGPEYLFDSELNIRSQNLNRLETGFNLYPSTRSAFRWRALTYDAKPEDGIEQPLYSIFSQGRLYETSAQIEYQFSKHLISSFSFGYDNYLLLQQPAIREDGFKLEVSTRYAPQSFFLDNALYIVKSFGGDVYGGKLALGYKLSDHTEFNGGAEISHYSKVTSSKRNAITSLAGISFTFLNNFKLNLAAEFNTNNAVRQDARAMAKLVYLLWTDS